MRDATAGFNRIWLLALATVAVLAASLALAPGVAHAYQVIVEVSGAGQVTETTSANLLGSGCVSPTTTPTASRGAYCRAGHPDGPYGWGWVVRYEAHPHPGYRFLRWESAGDGLDPVICDGSGGYAEYTGSACQFATFSNLQTRAVFADTRPPVEVRITKGPSQPVNGPATFDYELDLELYQEPPDPTFKQFECRVRREDGSTLHNWRPCGTDQEHGSLNVDPPLDGLYFFDVQAVDYSGNVSIRGFQSYSWTVDKTAPQTVLDPDYGPAEGSTTASDMAFFRFASNEAGSSFRCQIDEGSWQPCVSLDPLYDFAHGPHTFRVKAMDDAGNEDATPEERRWTVDTSVPTVVSTSPAANAKNVPLSTSAITATFSKAMDPLMYYPSVVRLDKITGKGKKAKATPVAIAQATLSQDGKTLTIRPAAPLTRKGVYRATITTGASDPASRRLAADKVWSFTMAKR